MGCGGVPEDSALQQRGGEGDDRLQQLFGVQLDDPFLHVDSLLSFRIPRRRRTQSSSRTLAKAMIAFSSLLTSTVLVFTQIPPFLWAAAVPGIQAFRRIPAGRVIGFGLRTASPRFPVCAVAVGGGICRSAQPSRISARVRTTFRAILALLIVCTSFGGAGRACGLWAAGRACGELLPQQDSGDEERRLQGDFGLAHRLHLLWRGGKGLWAACLRHLWGITSSAGGRGWF